MKEVKELGLKSTGYIDKRYGTVHRARFSIFECPVCKKEYELKRTVGVKRTTCKDCRGTQNATHGHSSKKYYNVWQAMIQRCENPNNPKYPIYGGNGISVCDVWKTFEGFWKDNEQFYKPGLSIDRMDSSKGYNPENTRWITKERNSSETTKRRPVVQLRQILKPELKFVPIKTWDSAKQAADELGLTSNSITAVCSPKYKVKTHGGFGWKYKEETK